jgi:HK97 family phage prohead protease
MDLEQQFAQDRVEARSVAFTDVEISKDGWSFEGLAAVYDQEVDLGDFTESVNRGAYRKAVPSSGNIPMLYHHNAMLPVLATTGAGTLRLSDEVRGLRVKAAIAQHYVGEAVRELVKRGDIRGMSAGFIVGRGNSRVEQRASKPHRSIMNFKQILDVSPTWNPAYTGTTAELRSLRVLQVVEDIGQGMAAHNDVRRLEGLPPLATLSGDRIAREFRALTTPQLQNTLGGLQSIAEAFEAALNQVGVGEPEEAEEVSPGPFTDQQYAAALETIQSLIEAAEGLLEGTGLPDPDETEPAARSTAASGAESADADAAAKISEKEQRSGVDSADADAAARRRRLHMMGLTLPKAA